jgi:diguanylate cyclase (GGDEF)-like protein
VETDKNLSAKHMASQDLRPANGGWLANLEKHPNRFIWTAVGLLMVGGIGILDYLTGYELAFSLFYLLPISLLTWLAGRRLGVVMALFSALVWLIADVVAGHAVPNPIIFFWNTLIRLGFFLIVVYLLTALRGTLEHERELNRVDSLTGAVNFRFFSTILQMEIDRNRRYERPFTIAYIDIDNFKTINDQFGHTTGDHLLRSVVQYAQAALRKTDSVARLGGDEFAILLPETGQVAATAFISRIQKGLLEEMQKGNWPVTFSIGVLTCQEAPQSVDEVIRLADGLMYSVKKNGKNAIQVSTCV